MVPSSYRNWILGLLTSILLASSGLTQEPTHPTPDMAPVLQNPIEVQTRGPIHEAYAQPLEGTAQPEPMVPREPPSPIPEEPPSERPENQNAQWIPGYWAWDAERQDYLWVSGVYRVPPQGRNYVPGYWSQENEGWRWVAGFWTGQQQQVPYAPQPPAPLDNGPTLPPPDDNSSYIPGSWVYRESRFVWRPGYWTAFQPGRVWIPAHYTWTPNGYLLVEGYWDYPLEERGLIFAPVYFRRPLWSDEAWAYRPSYVVSFPAFFDSGFIRGSSYYFGDYYGSNDARLGYRPWYSGRSRHDPLFGYHGWQQHRDNPNWFAGVQESYARRASGRAALPPRTLAQLNTSRANGIAVIAPLSQAASVNSLRLTTTTSNQLSVQKSLASQNRSAAQNRRQLDAALSAQNRSNSAASTSTTPSLNLSNVLSTRSNSLSASLQGTSPSGVNPAMRVAPDGTRRFDAAPNRFNPSFTPRSTIAPSQSILQTPARTFTPQVTPQTITPAPKTFTPPAPQQRKTSTTVSPNIITHASIPHVVHAAAQQVHVNSTSRPVNHTPPARVTPPARSSNQAASHQPHGGSSHQSKAKKK